MKEDLANLLKLQDVDAKIFRMKTSKENIPQEIEEVENLLNDQRAQLEHSKSKVSDFEKQKKLLEGEIKVEEERILKDKGRLTQVKSNNEYHALLREIDNSRREISERETQIIKILENVDEGKQGMEEIDKSVANLEKELKEKKDELQIFLNNVDKDIKVYEEERKKYVDKINGPLLRKYHMIKNKKSYTDTLTRIEHNTCAACNMNLPPQMVNEVRAMTHVHICPTCERILYWSDDSEKED